MVVGRNLVPETQHHLAAVRELTVHFVEVPSVCFHIQFGIGPHPLFGNLGNAGGYFPFVLVAKDIVAVLHQFVEGTVRIGPLIFPEVFPECP